MESCEDDFKSQLFEATCVCFENVGILTDKKHSVGFYYLNQNLIPAPKDKIAFEEINKSKSFQVMKDAFLRSVKSERYINPFKKSILKHFSTFDLNSSAIYQVSDSGASTVYASEYGSDIFDTIKSYFDGEKEVEMDETYLSEIKQTYERMEVDGYTGVVVTYGHKNTLNEEGFQEEATGTVPCIFTGILFLRQELKEKAFETVQKLQMMNKRVIILSGDLIQIVERIAKELKINHSGIKVASDLQNAEKEETTH